MASLLELRVRLATGGEEGGRDEGEEVGRGSFFFVASLLELRVRLATGNRVCGTDEGEGE